MSEHHGSSFAHSCVKVPVDPYSRQPTPLYERPRIETIQKRDSSEKGRRINFAGRDAEVDESHGGSLENLLDFLESIPDYGEVHHLSNEQFKRKLDYLKRKQRLLLKNLRNCLDHDDEKSVKTNEVDSRPATSCQLDSNKMNEKPWIPDTDLKLRGKKCSLVEGSRTDSPLLFTCGTFAGLAEDQDLLTYRCKYKDKVMKTMRNREIHSAGKSWSTWSESKTGSDDSDSGNSVETRSLPPSSPKRWHPTVPKPFRFAVRDEAEKYMTMAEMEAEDRSLRDVDNNSSQPKKRRVRPIPLTSRIPLYDKLMAAKEERSRMIREESAWSLMSQVKPFRLECERRASKAISRSSPELCTRNANLTGRFKAKPVPRNLFGTEVYDRMLEDEYYRQLQKKVRAAELLRSASLPPSMARRERVKSAVLQSRNYSNEKQDRHIAGSPEMCSMTPATSERSRSAMTELSTRGNNLAAILRCQASRDKLEREIRDKMEEENREQMIKLRSTLISRKPAWRALRQAAREEHERDLDFRTCLRRDEAREQAERHRLEMEMMLNRVTQIPTLFERHSQSYQTVRNLQSRQGPKCVYKPSKKKKRKPTKRQNSSSLESDASPLSASRPGSGSLTSSSSARVTASRSSKSSSSQKSERSTGKSDLSTTKKKSDRGPLRVSINETAELIEDRDAEKTTYSSDRSRRGDVRDDIASARNENVSARH